MMITKLVSDEHCVTRRATMSDPLRISAARTMECTNGVNGSAEMGPDGRSDGSTEFGNSGGDVIPSRTSFTCGLTRLDVFSDMERLGPRFPLREARWMAVDDDEDFDGCILMMCWCDD